MVKTVVTLYKRPYLALVAMLRVIASNVIDVYSRGYDSYDFGTFDAHASEYLKKIIPLSLNYGSVVEDFTNKVWQIHTETGLYTASDEKLVEVLSSVLSSLTVRDPDYTPSEVEVLREGWEDVAERIEIA